MADDEFSQYKVKPAAPVSQPTASDDEFAVYKTQPQSAQGSESPGVLERLGKTIGGLIPSVAGDWPQLITGGEGPGGIAPNFRRQVGDVSRGIAAMPGQVWPALARSGQAMIQGDAPNAAWHFAGAFPMLGAATQDIAQDVGSGNYLEAGVKTGALYGPTLLEAGGAGLAKLRDIRPSVTPSGIPLSFSERQPGSWWRGPAERFIENRPTGRGPQAAFRERQAATARGVASDVGEGMAPPHTAEEAGIGAGDTIRSGIEARQSALDAQIEAGNAARTAQAEANNAKNLSTFEANQKAAQAQLDANRTSGAAKAAGEEAAFYDMADKLGPPAAPEVYGGTVKKAAQTAYDNFKSRAGDLYWKVDQLVGKPSVSTAGIKAQAGKLLTDLRGTGGIIGSDEATKSIAMLENMIGHYDVDGQLRSGLGDTAGFRQLQILRSEMLRQLRKVDTLLPGRYAGAEKQMVGAFTDAMQDAAAKAGGPKAVAALGEANDFYRTNAGVFRDGIISDVLDANPEKVGGLAWQPNAVTNPRALLNLIRDDPGAVNALRRAGLDQIIQRATNATGELNGKIVAKEIRRMGETAKLLFGGDPEAFINQANKVHSAQQEAALAVKATLGKEKFIPETPELLKPPDAPRTRAESILLRTADTAPETMAEKLFVKGGGSISMIRAARRLLTADPDLWDGMRRSAWEKMVGDAMTPSRNTGGPAFNSRSIANAWDNLKPEVQEVLAGTSDNLKRINGIMNEMRSVDTSKAIKLRTPATGFVEPVALLSGHPGAAGGALAIPRMISEAMVNPNAGRSAVRNVGRRMQTGGRVGMGVVGAGMLRPPLTPPPDDQP